MSWKSFAIHVYNRSRIMMDAMSEEFRERYLQVAHRKKLARIEGTVRFQPPTHEGGLRSSYIYCFQHEQYILQFSILLTVSENSSLDF